ncbi:gamma-mobile-trio recombinase GmtY [Pseudomonas koreensis]|uniref:gamma-mobile-trio recombinase GmtY n=1 Tax=Pseudomonas koreensis TaxID=198620 RepID=UPI0018E6ADAF|nr:gamma-mobile-trio recombinase GmtY [Pseudomonas koreensis]MBI6949759.1 site-specific integrase [Pseudomonas koreensis]
MAYVLKIRARYRSDATGREVLLPAVFTESGLVLSHLRYLAAHLGRSQAWRSKSVAALIRLIKYINANVEYYNSATELLRGFQAALNGGSFNQTTLEDPSGLYWRPLTAENASSVLWYITHYTDWLSRQSAYSSIRINGFRKATSTEARLNWCAYYNKERHVFLNYLNSYGRVSEEVWRVRDVKADERLVGLINSAVRFPESKIDDLMRIGFVRRDNRGASVFNEERPDYKGQAITMLMHYGGVRRSEALQLYLQDVMVDKVRGEALVRVYHPSLGRSPDEAYSTRGEYLAIRFRLKPRNQYLVTERLHLGWKRPLLTNSREGYFAVSFFPPEKAVEFLSVFTNYLKFQRVSPPEYENHPYAFTNCYGAPETAKNFSRLHKAAVERLELKHCKQLGTTEHGHRHAYGYRLSEYGFTPLEIKVAMHHRAISSQQVYTQKSDEDVRKYMRSSYERNH